jgi:hypothetical protein
MPILTDTLICCSAAPIPAYVLMSLKCSTHPSSMAAGRIAVSTNGGICSGSSSPPAATPRIYTEPSQRRGMQLSMPWRLRCISQKPRRSCNGHDSGSLNATIAQLIQRQIAQLVKTGDPNVEGDPQVPLYHEQGNLLYLGDDGVNVQPASTNTDLRTNTCEVDQCITPHSNSPAPSPKGPSFC